MQKRKVESSRRISMVQEWMSLVPKTIGSGISVSKASEIMRKYDVRHLPVLREGKLIGLVSERDIRIAKAFPGPGELSVEDVMTSDPHVFRPEALLDDVATDMIEHKLGCAVIVPSGGNVVGIFTTIDALRALKSELNRSFARRVA